MNSLCPIHQNKSLGYWNIAGYIGMMRVFKLS
jgi:hypothetical protein